MKINHSATFPFGYGTTVGELRRFLDKFPDNAKVSVGVDRGDRPWESDSYKVTVNWDEES